MGSSLLSVYLLSKLYLSKVIFFYEILNLYWGVLLTKKELLLP